MKPADDFVEHVLTVLDDYSRTVATGRIDTSTSPDKPSDFGLASHAVLRGTITEARRLVQHIDSPRDYLALSDHVNHRMTRRPTLNRTWDRPDFGWIPASKISTARTEHAESIVRDLGKALPLHAAAKTIWFIDLKGHYYADGCGRTAITLALSILSRSGLRPRLGRQQALAAASSIDPVGSLADLLLRSARD